MVAEFIHLDNSFIMKYLSRIIIALSVLGATAVSCGPKDGDYYVDIFSTNDVHGSYFDSLYVRPGIRPSLYALSRYVDSVRTAVGADKVVLLDIGDILQGDNAAYYYNYVDTSCIHPYASMANYMGYDALVVGNHDVETGHPVYDRVRRELDMPWLGGNAVRVDNGKPYFDDYCIIRRQGLKIAVIGGTNANNKAWLSEELWRGMDFQSLTDYVQPKVDYVIRTEHPQIVLVAVHSGTGAGDGTQLENQGLDLLNSLNGVDAVFCAHDHRPFVTEASSGTVLVNSGSRCQNIGHVRVSLRMENGRVASKTSSAELVRVREEAVDTVMRSLFHPEYEAVRAFSNRPVGELFTELRTRDAYCGMSDYMDLIHTLGLSQDSVDISFAAPLSFNRVIRPGTLIYNDLFTVYPYENTMFVVKMNGEEIRNYLEASYSHWINTVPLPVLMLAAQNPSEGSPRILNVVKRADPRNGQPRWSFAAASFNFDSAAGIDYTVDVTRPAGERISILSLADGREFLPDGWYNVAMTSYRASGGGALVGEGAGITPEILNGRIVAKYPEYRELLYEYLRKHGAIRSEELRGTALLGEWKFIPEAEANALLQEDMSLLFRH